MQILYDFKNNIDLMNWHFSKPQPQLLQTAEGLFLTNSKDKKNNPETCEFCIDVQ